MSNLQNVRAEDKAHIDHVRDGHGYDGLRQTQTQAFEEGALDDSNHLLVADTGNGKTLVAESLTRKHLQRENTVAYLVPSTQLVRDKRDAIAKWTDEDVTVATGAGKYYSGDVIVATFASFYQAILRGAGDVTGIDLVVLDDFHELYGNFIGPELEKAIAAAKYEGMQLFAMSATIGNPVEIASWLDATLTVSNEDRGVPIREHSVTVGRESKKSRLASFIASHESRHPFLVFNFAKSWTESRAREIADTGVFADLADENTDMKQQMRRRVDGTLPDKLGTLATAMENGVAFHHSDVPRNIKRWIESLFQDGQLGCICATTTIAYGFDSPVQSVVVADMKRRGRWVGKWEYQQWIGRAARPGYGYDEGHAYVLSDDQQTVTDEFFAPRELEPIQSHIDSPSEFRRFMLELIELGWDTPEIIEEFVSGTLYWSQLQDQGAWGREFDPREKRLKRKLKKTAGWLESHGFIRERQTAVEFESTELGTAAVEFLFSASRDVPLTEVHELYTYIQQADTLERLPLLAHVADIFGLGMNDRNASAAVEQTLHEQNLQQTKETITAAVLHMFWIQNKPVKQIEQQAKVDASYIDSAAYRVSSMFSATTHLIDASAKRPPEWFDRYAYRIKRGIRLEEQPYVQNVTGLGRAKVRNLRTYLESSAVPVSAELDGSFPERIDGFTTETQTETRAADVLADNVSGIGDELSRRIVTFHTENTISSVFKDAQSDSSGRTTLGDF